MRLSIQPVLFLLLCCASQLPAEEPDFSPELPRIPAVEPEKALATMQIKPGYRLELAAAEPLVASPVAVCWDERGRMFVVEMRGYSEHREEKLSRVRMLTDEDNDGVYDKSVLFAEQLLWPTAIHCWNGGLFVADAPDILYLKDTTGDGVADVRERVFTGFGTQNVQGLLNTFLWGLDNRIHGSASSNGGNISIVSKPETKPISVNGRDFSFDPRTLDFRAESGGAQHGMTFDDFGRKFVCSNSDHCQQVMYEDRYLVNNPLFAPPPARVSIAADGPQAEVFRISPVEPWRIVRTRLRVSGATPGLIEGGGRAAGYFTGATGLTQVRGSAFAEDEMYGMMVVGDVGSNLIHRKQLTLAGVQYTAQRIDSESEFIASSDNWFRPAQFANGPDGALYAIDVYREVIEHPASLPPVIKKHLDLDSGRDRGRIWRIAPEKWQRPKFESLHELSDAELVLLLNEKNAWHRETAARLLFERQPQVFIQLNPGQKYSEVGRIQELYTLAGLEKLSVERLVQAFEDSSPRVREHAIRLAERDFFQWDKVDSEQLESILQRMIAKEDRQLQYQLAFSASKMPKEVRLPLLSKLFLYSNDDRWVRAACLTSLPDANELLFQLLEDLNAEKPMEFGLLLELMRLEGRRRDPHTISKLFELLQKLPPKKASARVVLLPALYESSGLSRAEFIKLASNLKENQPEKMMLQARDEAIRLLNEENTTSLNRWIVIPALALGPFAEAEDALTALLSPREAPELQLAALQVLKSYVEPGSAGLIVKEWKGLPPETRRAALDVLLSRPEWTLQLLAAIAEKQIPTSDVDSNAIALLKKHSSKAVQERAAEVFDSTTLARRSEVVEQYRSALDLLGIPDQGRIVFRKNCAGCHKSNGEGYELGPNLAAMKNRGAEAIILNVLDPNREVNPQFLNYVLNTTDGRTLTGVVAAESAAAITLKRAEGQGSEVLRADIEELRSTGLSLMPEGFEKQLDPQDMADLIAYLLTLK